MTSSDDSNREFFMMYACQITHIHVNKNLNKNCENPSILRVTCVSQQKLATVTCFYCFYNYILGADVSSGSLTVMQSEQNPSAVPPIATAQPDATRNSKFT